MAARQMCLKLLNDAIDVECFVEMVATSENVKAVAVAAVGTDCDFPRLSGPSPLQPSMTDLGSLLHRNNAFKTYLHFVVTS